MLRDERNRRVDERMIEKTRRPQLDQDAGEFPVLAQSGGNGGDIGGWRRCVQVSVEHAEFSIVGRARPDEAVGFSPYDALDRGFETAFDEAVQAIDSAEAAFDFLDLAALGVTTPSSEGGDL